MKSPRTLLWAALCLLPLAQQIARAQTIVHVSSGLPPVVQPADGTPGLIPPVNGIAQVVPPANVTPQFVAPDASPPQLVPPDYGTPPQLGPPAPAAPVERIVPDGDPRILNMLSSPLGPSVGISESRTVLTTSTVTTPTPVTTTTLQTETIRVVKVMGATTVISFRTVKVPVTTTTTVNRTSTVTTPKTQVLEYRIPAVGGFRISDDESPLPQTRVFYYLNDWQQPFDAANTKLGGNASLPYAVRNTFGYEQAFADGAASLGFRLPIDSLKVDSSLPGTAAVDSSIGDLFLVSKVLIYRSQAGSAISGGLAMTLPTGSRSFAGVSQGDVGLDHHANLQPYIGYLWRATDGIYVQGFSSIDVPLNPSDVAMMYNDIGVGYFLFGGAGWLTALAPTAELRVTTPLNHDGVMDGKVYGETQIVQFLFGLTMEMNRRTTLTVGAGVPVTGPNPYDWQFILQMNYRF
jgi:hypothetical protein